MKSYLLKIRGGVEVDSMGKKAGKGALIQEEVSATLGTAQDQYLFQPVISIDRYNQECDEEVAPTLKSINGGDDIHAVMVENHPNDSRVDIDESGTCQTLTQRMGTGGGNVPLVICLEGNGSRTSHHGDGYSESDKMYSLNTVERHAVAYTVDEKMGQTYIHEEQANTLAARDYKQPPAHSVPETIRELEASMSRKEK